MRRRRKVDKIFNQRPTASFIDLCLADSAMDFRELLTTRQPSMGVRLVRCLLWPVSVLYGIGARFKNAQYDWGWKSSFDSKLCVISVGNLSVGGTGKSPVVSWLASFLRRRDIRVAILSRGYGQLAEGQNDEALELEMLHPDVPHLQHWDRVASARLAEDELEMQCLLLDDGFQHRRMGRDLDIVLLDASCPPHTQRLLPAGLFREPMSSLSRCHIVILTRVDQADENELNALKLQIKRSNTEAVVIESSHQPNALVAYPNERLPVSETLTGRSVLAFCGIGNANSFFDSLEKQGCKILDRKRWPDHHAYSADDVEELGRWASEHQADFLVCTVKDWVKLQTANIQGVPLLALRIELSVIAGEDELTRYLDQLLSRRIEASEPLDN